ncbi:sec-independent protein translocase protein TatA [Azospirillum agricola]|uniref:twin-arginine translocase TatA/TatE family subunit n=1 Tax=Azospirillum agricola TaxID=1720247 RepID=UPI001AEA6F61|nr:twin-arginine translocase TatA/TatE family subunit [Azospirillum agricola]MBP2227136.1 sec-independent protein translocase protein TatA [Azospirillum agricola]
MGSFSIWHWIIVLVIVLLLFGAGKLPSVMGDIAKGVKAFKAGMKDEDETPAAPPPVAATQPRPTVSPAASATAPQQPAALDPAHVKPAPATDPTKPNQG